MLRNPVRIQFCSRGARARGDVRLELGQDAPLQPILWTQSGTREHANDHDRARARECSRKFPVSVES